MVFQMGVCEDQMPWRRHTIDDTSQGADGTRLADVNGDGLLDIATPWEQGGVVRVYLNPGPKAARQPWRKVTVGEVESPEDAVFVDLDADGSIDVVSACEGKTKSLFVHWAPRDTQRYLDANAWRTEAIPACQGTQAWMYIAPLQVDGKHGIDLICGAKGQGAQVGWLESPAEPRDLRSWKWHSLRDAGWIMSIEPRDVDADGDPDILLTDRKGPNRGCFWLEHPGAGPRVTTHWREHRIGSAGKEAMFLQAADLDRGGMLDVLVAIRKDGIDYHRLVSLQPVAWRHQTIRWPDRAGTAKSVAIGDIDQDGAPDIVCSSESAREGSGVVWLRSAARYDQDSHPRTGSINGTWERQEISGPRGAKFDRVELIDLDGDSDLDVLTSEETDALGVIWYENPTR
jgi:hypothetical protein